MADMPVLPDAASLADGVYQIFSLRYARLARNARQNLLARDVHDGPMPLDYNIWILRNAHRTVLVDTGFGQRAAAQRGRPLLIDPIDALSRVGIDPDAIEDIVITHLHYDHAGNMDRFGKARFHLQQAEIGFATGRCMCDQQQRAPFDVEDVVTFIRHTYADRVRFHDGEAAPLPGISLHVLPGHTPGMQAVRVVTPRGPVVLASDISHFYANFLRRESFVGTVDLGEALRSYEGLMAIAGAVERIVPGHDPKVRDLYPGHVVGGIELTALHEVPKPHNLEELASLANFRQVYD
ncbi:N-acyl homoserine lactonase family protein [soil metagenome]